MWGQKSFTIIELLVVIAIIGLLASITLVSLKGAIERARMGKAQVEMDQIKKAMLVYKSEFKELPPPRAIIVQPATILPIRLGHW